MVVAAPMWLYLNVLYCSKSIYHSFKYGNYSWIHSDHNFHSIPPNTEYLFCPIYVFNHTVSDSAITESNQLEIKLQEYFYFLYSFFIWDTSIWRLSWAVFCINVIKHTYFWKGWKRIFAVRLFLYLGTFLFIIYFLILFLNVCFFFFIQQWCKSKYCLKVGIDIACGAAKKYPK